MIKALIGNGGHAREVMAQMNDKSMIRFVDDQYYDNKNKNVKPISQFDSSKYEVLVAIGDSKTRHDIVRKLPEETKYFTFVHHTALILGQEDIVIGEGTFIGAYSILTTNIKIGKHSLLNRFNQIGHDTVCGDYLSMMPGSVLSGNIIIGHNFYMGTNSSVKEKIKICNDVTLGINAAVVKNISEPGTYIGVPVKKLNHDSHTL